MHAPADSLQPRPFTFCRLLRSGLTCRKVARTRTTQLPSAAAPPGWSSSDCSHLRRRACPVPLPHCLCLLQLQRLAKQPIYRRHPVGAAAALQLLQDYTQVLIYMLCAADEVHCPAAAAAAAAAAPSLDAGQLRLDVVEHKLTPPPAVGRLLCWVVGVLGG